jgi:thiamine pyrophosphokinase
MKKFDKYILFLNNRYSGKDNDFYLKAVKNKVTVAVDGGIRFFLKNKITPDLLIGDFDSSPRLSRKYLSQFEVVKHPSDKDKTDSQLALEIVLNRGAKQIEICGAFGTTEIDHTLGNVFLLELVNKFKKRHHLKIHAFLMSPSQRVLLVNNDTVSLTGKAGDYISVVPLSGKIRLNFRGLKYRPPAKPLIFGDSLTLRNQLLSKNCRISIKGGKVVVVMVKKGSRH